MESDPSYDRNEETLSDSSREMHAQRRRHKGGKHLQEQPTSLVELLAYPLAITCFQHQSCYQFCEMAERV